MSKQSQVMAQVTYQALFRSFPKLCGMTGTALTDANELEGTYGLQVVQVTQGVPRLRSCGLGVCALVVDSMLCCS